MAFTGPKATYVALCSVTTISLAMVNSIWLSDVSGSSALLGLLAVYLASSELLVLYSVFSPASILIDIIRVWSISGIRGKGWLVFFMLIETVTKILGALFAWALYKEVTGDGTALTAEQHGAPSVQQVPEMRRMPQGQYTPPAQDIGNMSQDPWMSGAPQQQQEQQQPQLQTSYMPFPTSTPPPF